MISDQKETKEKRILYLKNFQSQNRKFFYEDDDLCVSIFFEMRIKKGLFESFSSQSE